MILLRKQKITVAVISDTHIGSTVSLCPPSVRLDDGQSVNISIPQKWLWQNWIDFWTRAKDLGNREIYTFILGDIFDNLHHGTTQLWSDNEADWKKAALELFDVPKRLSKHIFSIRGTTIHTKGGGSLDEEMSIMLKTIPDSLGNSSSWTRQVYVEGVLFDLAHKGPIGRLPWTTGNMLNRLPYEVIAKSIKEGSEIPSVILRSHNHMYSTSSDDSPVLVVACPAWQLCTEYGYNLNPARISDIGGLLFECWDGHFEFHKVLYTPEREKPWRQA